MLITTLIILYTINCRITPNNQTYQADSQKIKFEINAKNKRCLTLLRTKKRKISTLHGYTNILGHFHVYRTFIL